MKLAWYRGLLLLVVWSSHTGVSEPLPRRTNKRHNPKGLGDPDSHLRESQVSSRSRPLPSDSLPLVGLVEEPDEARDPKDRDLNYKKLRRFLGKSFDPAFMSVVKPNELLEKPNGTVVYKFRKGRPKGKMPGYIKSFASYRLADGRKMRLRIKKRTKQKVQRYLWGLNHCPVQYVWRDLGLRFWPRWIREGICYSGRSCSIPPGMKCKPFKEIQKIILRWHCKSTDTDELDCAWIHVHYPIIDECQCAC